MENKIKELIEKYKEATRNPLVSAWNVVNDLQSLLEFKQKNCCGKAGNGETTNIHTEK